MKITQEKVDDLNAILSVEIAENDYNLSVQDKLRDHAKKVSMPGFRPGKVPFGMVKKMYEASAKVDVINNLVSDQIFKHIEENKLQVLGQPLPIDSGEIDFEKQKEFTFKYEMGLHPKFDLKLSDKVKLTYNKVVPDVELVDNYVEELTMRFGKISNPEIVGESDLVAVDVLEINPNKSTEELFAGIYTVSIERITNEKIKNALLGKKKDEKIEANVKELGKTLDDSISILGLKKGDLDNTSTEFEVTVGTISKMEPAELNQDLFDKVYGPGTVTTVDAFREKVKEETQKMLGDQGKYQFKNDIIEYFLENLKFSLPDAFMKKWLVASSKGKLTADSIEKEYHHYEKSLRWQVIESKLIDENNIKVEASEAKAKAMELIAANFAQYGQSVPEDQLSVYADSILKKEEEVRRLYDELYYDKIMDLIKEKCAVNTVEVPYKEFLEKVKPQHDHDHPEHVHDENCNHDHDHEHAHAHHH